MDIFRCFLNKQEIKDFPRSLLTKCPVEAWYISLGAGIVIVSLMPWFGIWILAVVTVVYIALEHIYKKYALMVLYTTFLGIVYWFIVSNPTDWRYWLLAVLVLILGLIGWKILDRLDPNFYKRDCYMYDKLMHFAGWGALTIYAFPILSVWFSYPLSILFSALFSLAFGILYEVKDCFLADGFSVIDLLADVVGIGVACILLLVFRL